MRNIVVLDNPFINGYINILRNKHTKPNYFTWTLKHIGRDMLYDIIRHETSSRVVDLETPVGSAKGEEIAENLVLIEILRAAMPMASGARERVDELENISRSWGIVDAKRLEGENYCIEDAILNNKIIDVNIQYTTWKVPQSNEESVIFVLDPMLASGSTLRHVIERLQQERKYKKIVSLSIFAAKYGIEKMASQFPEVNFYTCAIDTGGINGSGLNKDCYIDPGCGDAGDRSANTD